MVSVMIQSQVHVHVNYVLTRLLFDEHTQYKNEKKSFNKKLST